MAVERQEDLEALFNESIEVDVVIGIPFHQEKDILVETLNMLDEGLAGLPDVRKPLIVCVGDPAGTGTLEDIRGLDLKAPCVSFLMKPGASGRGTGIRTILEIADRLEADAVILAAGLAQSRGLPADWISRLIEPIGKEYDIVLTSFQRHYFEDLLGSLFTAPLLEVFYGYHVKGSLEGVYALSHDIVADLCTDIKFWPDITQGSGVDAWLVSRAMRWNKRICEAALGTRLEELQPEELKGVFKENARSLFTCIKRDEDSWVDSRFIIRTPDVYGGETGDGPPNPAFPDRDVTLFKESYVRDKNNYDSTYGECLYGGSGDVEPVTDKDRKIEGKIWSEIVYRVLFKYWFVPGECSEEDLLGALTFAFSGRVSSFMEHIQLVEEQLKEIKNIDRGSMVSSEVASIKEGQRQDFLRLRDQFMQAWKQKIEEMKPVCTPVDYLEFVPGVPIVLPKRIEGRQGKVTSSEEMLNRLQVRYQEAFSRFIRDGLETSENAGSGAIIKRMEEFMSDLEKTMEWLVPGNLHTEEGTRQTIDGLFRNLHCPTTFSIKDEILQEMLLRFPPLNVMIPAGYKTSKDLVKKMNVRDAVSLANLVETRNYGARSALGWMLDRLRPDDMGEVEIRPIILGRNMLGPTLELGNISDFNQVTARIVVAPLKKGMGGNYAKLHFSLFVVRHLMMAQNYDTLWRTYAKERKNLGGKIHNSLVDPYQTMAFSAHNIFENFHHRAMVSEFRSLAQKMEVAGHNERARLIRIMCDSYGLSRVLADGTFLPCSAWSWASYSYRGGKGIPIPCFSHVEEKWFNHEFLEEIFKELAYDPGEITKMVIQLIGEGKASENLLDVLLGITPKGVTVMVQESQDYPPAKPLVRHAGNPVLSPIKGHSWESKYVLNTAALRVKDRVYLLYRAFGDDAVSRIGLAVTDGYNVLERLPEPVFGPLDPPETKGVEDPRVTIIGSKIYMLYTAYDGRVAQVSAAAIALDDLLNRRFDRWERKGPAFRNIQDIWDKDALLFPEKIDGKYVIYHRIEPSIWVSHLDKLEFPASKQIHSIILGPRSGSMWDSLKVGGGSQPIKTKYGWLLIYHGVDRNRVYRLGVILADLANPEHLLYRSPNPVLSPETEYEVGKEGESWVPNVVFTCGAVPAEDKEVLDAADEILVYYGAADTHICLATALVGDLIPERVRQEVGVSDT